MRDRDAAAWSSRFRTALAGWSARVFTASHHAVRLTKTLAFVAGERIVSRTSSPDAILSCPPSTSCGRPCWIPFGCLALTEPDP
jgi:hypothetical protein